MIDWNPYFDSLCKKYIGWSQFYTITDVVGRKREEAEPSLLLFDFGLMVQTVERQKEEKGNREEKIERLTVLEGLRKYASEHVLLVGRPGSGKSTALVRLVLEEAQKNLTPPALLTKAPVPCEGRGEQEFLPIHGKGRGESGSPLLAGEGQGERSTKVQGNQPKIPVLVELRYYRTSILDLIQDFLQQHDPKLTVDAETLKSGLRQGQLLLLVDGLNELPSEEARRELHKFRQDYQKTTPMIFTTRDLGVGGDLDIAKKLEMQPLSEAQMQQFVRKYLPEQGEQMLRQLGSRLRDFGQTPLLLLMLCLLFRVMGKVPPNLGLMFHQFAKSYEVKLQQDCRASKESRRWGHLLLKHLAWVMTFGEMPTELQVAISKQKAEAVLTKFLQGKMLHPENCALCCLEDLLNHHLIQLGAGDQIEFRHQLIQEYYTAEHLLKLLPSLSDDELKREYLNYLKWTEPLALMLELVEDEAQAVRVVKLALEVDLRLGARLAGAVKPEWQEQTVSLVTTLDIPPGFQIQLLGLTKSERAILKLMETLKDSDDYLRKSAVDALGETGSETAVPELVKALEDSDISVRSSAVDALGKIGSETAVPELVKALEDSDISVRSNAVDALGKIGSETAVPELVKVLKHPDYSVRKSAVNALGEIGSEMAIPELVKTLEDPDTSVCTRAADALGKIGSEAAILKLFNALENPKPSIRQNAANSLSKISSEAVISKLVNTLQDENVSVRMGAAESLNKIVSGTDINIETKLISKIVKALEDSNSDVRWRAANVLGKIGSKTAITGLVKALKDSESDVRWRAANALGEIGSEKAIPKLVEALEDSVLYVRTSAADALGEIGSETAIPKLVKILENSESSVRKSAVYALGKIGLEKAIPELVKVLEDSDSTLRLKATEALGEIGLEKAIPELVKVLEDSDSTLRFKAAEALGKIGSEAAIPELVKALED